MRPVSFEGATHILNPPENVGNAEALVVRMVVADLVEQVSCWELEPGDLDEIVRTGRVWLRVCGTRHPLVSVESFRPFEEPTVVEPETVRVAPPPIVGGSRGPRGWQ